MDDTNRVVSTVERYLFRVPTMVYVEVLATNAIAAKLKLDGTQRKERGEGVAYRDYKAAELIATLPTE